MQFLPISRTMVREFLSLRNLAAVLGVAVITWLFRTLALDLLDSVPSLAVEGQRWKTASPPTSGIAGFVLILILTGALWFAQRTRAVRDSISAALIGVLVAVVGGLPGTIASGGSGQAPVYAAARGGVMLFALVGSSVLLHLLVARASSSGTAVTAR